MDPLPVAAVDVRFPTSLTSDGSDAMHVLGPSIFVGWRLKADIGTRNAIIRALYTSSDLAGHGVCSHCFPNEFYTHNLIYQMTFTIGRGNDIVRLVSLFLGSCKIYRFWSHRSAWQCAKWRTGSSERKQTICSRIWARLGIISSPILNYDGRSHSERPF